MRYGTPFVTRATRVVCEGDARRVGEHVEANLVLVEEWRPEDPHGTVEYCGLSVLRKGCQADSVVSIIIIVAVDGEEAIRDLGHVASFLARQDVRRARDLQLLRRTIGPLHME